MSSFGMTPYDFVQQVYYVQEKTLLDFWPTDDKYKEVLMEGNLVSQELTKEEDWSWRRERVVLGPCTDFGRHGSIPEFALPPKYYKPATHHKDAVRLHPMSHHCHGCHDHGCGTCGHALSNPCTLQAKFRSQGSINHPKQQELGSLGEVYVGDHDLNATWTAGNVITFDRPLSPWEQHCIAETDMILRIPPLHICGPDCSNWRVEDIDDEEEARKVAFGCEHIEKNIFSFIPDPYYMVIRTAARHAEGSPPQQGRVMGLQDQAQKILSSMRQNEAVQTTSDVIQSTTLDFFTVI